MKHRTIMTRTMILVVALTGIYLSVRAATKTETRHIYLQTVLWVSKEGGPPATVKKYGEVYGFSPSTIPMGLPNRAQTMPHCRCPGPCAPSWA